jgi:transcriptional regulator with XRE-family HTH domain
MSDMPKWVGDEVAACRKRARLSQVEMSQALDRIGVKLSQAAISKIEIGERTLTYVEAVALRGLVGFDSSAPDVVRDALAYRRILRVIGEREADAMTA